MVTFQYVKCPIVIMSASCTLKQAWKKWIYMEAVMKQSEWRKPEMQWTSIVKTCYNTMYIVKCHNIYNPWIKKDQINVTLLLFHIYSNVYAYEPHVLKHSYTQISWMLIHVSARLRIRRLLLERKRHYNKLVFWIFQREFGGTS